MSGTLSYLLAGLVGALGWTLTEYSIHRFLFHGKSRWSAALQHRQHHRDVDYYPSTREKFIAALQVMPVVVGIPLLLVTSGLALAFSAGFLGMYLIYTRFHHACHWVAPGNAYTRWCRKQHFAHHFHKPHLNHGVTCPWWDMVFGTYEEVDQIVVPERQAMEWLINPETGDVWEEFANDYVLRRRKVRKAA